MPTNKITDDDLKPPNLARNERARKIAERQMQEDGRLPRPEKRKKKKQTSPDNLTTKSIRSSDAPPLLTTRLDAVVFIAVLAIIIGCVAVGIQIHAYSMDQNWNSILAGESKFMEINDHKVFIGKTLRLQGHAYLTKAAEYVTRNEPLELLFIIVILSTVIVTLVHICFYYVKVTDVESYAALLVGVYVTGAMVVMLVSPFPVIASINIENGYSYGADMLHNFQHISVDPPVSSNDQDRCQGEYKNGCDYYEYAKLQCFYLERIFRQCGSGSRFTRYFGEESETQTYVKVFEETFYRSELKDMGFCSRDGYKYVAAICAIIMGILFAIIPIIFCCESKAESKRDSIAESEGVPRRSLEDAPATPIRAEEYAVAKEPVEGGPQEEQQMEKSEEDEEYNKYADTYLKEFRAYVEDETDEDELPAATSKVSPAPEELSQEVQPPSVRMCRCGAPVSQCRCVYEAQCDPRPKTC